MPGGDGRGGSLITCKACTTHNVPAAKVTEVELNPASIAGDFCTKRRQSVIILALRITSDIRLALNRSTNRVATRYARSHPAELERSASAWSVSCRSPQELSLSSQSLLRFSCWDDDLERDFAPAELRIEQLRIYIAMLHPSHSRSEGAHLRSSIVELNRLVELRRDILAKRAKPLQTNRAA
jgi:hypothetical protein